ncbi:fam-a protein [Plasmodium vinckei vinckei]|uniref:Fam-a protein n=1 Tax=Plasmodium vinckei vinckei TaxID=54757 RepID=A0A449BRZ5_PLAVN|nr:fam-a protein [Plasmodium vinckei vinckei]VEV56182.1 fam-a protein [Plasmodium vinckei vinckei]
MNKGHFRLFFFALSLFMYASNQALANEASLVNDNINNPVQTKANPEDDKPDKANKNLKNSDSSNEGQTFSSIILSILQCFACGAPKPKKNGQNMQVRGKSTPENDMPKKTTPENDMPKKPIIDNNARLDMSHQNNNHRLLCRDPEEIEKVTKLMNEATAILQKEFTSDNYNLARFTEGGARLFRKQKDTMDIGKLCISIEKPDKYGEIKDTIWNPNGFLNMDPSFLTGQVVRVYNPNLVMIQQCYTSGGQNSVKYFHYLAQKIEVSKDKTIMIYLSTHSADVNDSMEENMYTLLDIAYSLEPGCNYEEEFKKNYVNLSAYEINKDDKKVDIVYLDSIYDDEILAPLYDFKRVRSRKIIQLVNLKEKLTREKRYIPNSKFLLD